MGRKIFRSGNSAVVSLPSDALEATGLELGDEVTVTVDEEGRIIITPASPGGIRIETRLARLGEHVSDLSAPEPTAPEA